MSASASKKKRKELEQLGNAPQTVTAQKEQEKKKQTTRTILIFAAVIVVAAIALTLLINGLNAPSYDTDKAVISMGEQSVTVPVYNYFYNNIVSNFYNSYYYFIQTETPLSQQKSIFGGDGTLEDYFKDTTNTQLKEVLNIYGKALADGYKLSEDDRKSIDNALASVKTEASTYGFSSVNKYLAARFGEGCTTKNYEAYLEMYLTYVGYMNQIQENFAPTAEELSAEYQKDTSAYDVVTFTYATTDAKTDAKKDDETAGDPTETGEPSETGEASETKEPEETVDPEAAKEAARAEAEAKLENMDEGTSTVTYNKSSASSMNADLADWLFDAARKEGDTTVLSRNEDETSFYSVRFDKRDDNNYKLVNAYILSIKKDEGEVSEGTESADEKLEKLMDGLSDTMTDEEFETYVTGLGYTASQTRVTKTTYDELITDYLYDESRKPGEISMISIDNTYYIVRFASLDEETYQEAMVKNKLWNDYYESIANANEITVDADLLKYANTDLTFHNNSTDTGTDSLPMDEATPEDAAG